MAIQFEKMSTEDLERYKKRDYGSMSDEGLALVQAGRVAQTKASPTLPDASGVTQAPAGSLPPTGTTAGATDSRGGYRRRSTDMEGDPAHVPFTEWADNAGKAALNAPAAMAHGFGQLFGATKDATIEADRKLTEVPGGAFGDFAGGMVGGGLLGGAISKGLQVGAKFLPRALQSTAKYANIPASSAVTEGLTASTLNDESRAQKMEGAAVLSGALASLGAGGRRFLTGFTKPNADAEALIAMGIQPNASTGGTGKSAKVLTMAENMLDLGGRSKRFDRVERETMTRAGDDANMLNVEHLPVKRSSGADDYNAVRLAQNDVAYNNLLQNKNVPLPGGPLQFIGDALFNARAAMPHNDSAVGNVERQLSSILQPLKANPSALNWQKTREVLRGEMGALPLVTPKDRQVAAAYQRVEQMMNDAAEKSLGAAEWKTLQEYDKKYAKQMLISKALDTPHSQELLPFRNYYNAVEANKKVGQGAAKSSLGMDLTEPAKRNMNITDPTGPWERRMKFGAANLAAGSTALLNPMLAMGLPALWALGTASKSRGGSEFLMGQKAWQPKMAEKLRKYNPYAAIALQQGLQQAPKTPEEEEE